MLRGFFRPMLGLNSERVWTGRLGVNCRSPAQNRRLYALDMRLMLTGCLVLGAAAVFYAADNPKLPPPFATPSVRNSPKVIPQPAGAKLNVPAGFTMEIWAEGFKAPRFMMLGPSNEILMTDAARTG